MFFASVLTSSVVMWPESLVSEEQLSSDSTVVCFIFYHQAFYCLFLSDDVASDILYDLSFLFDLIFKVFLDIILRR